MLLGPLRVILNTDVYVFYLGNNHSKLCSCIMIYICPDHIYIVFSFKTVFKLSINRKSFATRLHVIYPIMTKGTVESFSELLKKGPSCPQSTNHTCSKPLLHKTALIRVTQVTHLFSCKFNDVLYAFFDQKCSGCLSKRNQYFMLFDIVVIHRGYLPSSP